MVAFNFRVRAKENHGAYADRDFSINVRNTIAEQFVATTTDGHIMTSVDGENWTWQLNKFIDGSSASNRSLGSVINGNGRWIVVISQTKYLLSQDGLNWDLKSFPTGYEFFGAYSIRANMVFGDGKFGVILRAASAPTYHYLFTSEDGVNWTKSDAALTQTSVGSYLGLAYGDGIWMVALASPTSSYPIGYKTTDGTSWTHVGSGMKTVAMTPVKIHYFNGLWVAIGHGRNYWLSNDSVSWSVHQLPETIDSCLYLRSWVYGNGLIACYPDAFTYSSSPTNVWNKVYTSTNAIDWTEHTLEDNLFFPYTQPSTQATSLHLSNSSASTHVEGIFYDGTFMFYSSGNMSVSSSTGGIVKSYNGVDWFVERVPPYSGTGGLYLTSMGALRQV